MLYLIASWLDHLIHNPEPMLAPVPDTSECSPSQLFDLADHYEASQPSFAEDLRAAAAQAH